MDILTQGVLGATTAIATSTKTFGIRKTIFFGFVFGILADFDLLLGYFINHPWMVHRGISHSLLFAPFIACIVMLYRFIRKKGLYKEWFWLIFWSLLTHPLLDLFTRNGTPLLMPLSYYRFALSAVSVVDLNYSLPLFISVVICWFLKSVDKAVFLNASILFFTSIYLLFGIVYHEKAIDIINHEQKKENNLPNDIKCRTGPDLFFIGNRYAICLNENTLYEAHFNVSLQRIASEHIISWEKKELSNELSIKNKIKNYISDKELSIRGLSMLKRIFDH